MKRELRAEIDSVKKLKEQLHDPRAFLRDFEVQIADAKLAAQEWLEVDPSVIEHFRAASPNRLGGKDYFCYHGIKVCALGKSESIQEKMDTQMSKILHPGEGKVATEVT